MNQQLERYINRLTAIDAELAAMEEWARKRPVVLDGVTFNLDQAQTFIQFTIGRFRRVFKDLEVDD